jgi:protein TonB
MLTNQVPPVYPPIAKQARVQGIVRLQAVIGENGTVEQLSTLEGPAMLRDAAMEAVRQWTYRPMMVNGRATKVVTEVEVNFTLQ